MAKRVARWSLVVVVLVAAGSLAIWLVMASRSSSMALAGSTPRTDSESEGFHGPAAPLRVETIKPINEGMEHTTQTTGSIYAFESAQLFAKVSGYLKTQTVDIGDHVRQNQVLAEIDTPELVKAVDQAKAALEQANAQVQQANARVLTAKADREAAAAAIKQAEAEVVRAKYNFQFRTKQFSRISDLAKSDSIDQRAADESEEQMNVARAAELLADAGVANAKALASASSARVVQAEADAQEAKAKVAVAEAALAKAQVYVDYSKIISPYDGVVTKRNFFRGEFIQSADQDTRLPLLTVDRTDKMRMVLQVPDRDSSMTNAGDDAVIDIDALPGKQFEATVSRVAEAEDSQTRTMRTEIDLPNDERLLRQGMFGLVTIRLGKLPGALQIPSSSLVGDVEDGDGKIYVVQAGVARLKPIRVGRDDGVHIEVLHGLSPDEAVVLHPTSALHDGARVSAVAAAAEKAPTRRSDGR